MAVTFEDQVVLVTGAGRGLGRLYALELAARGAAMIVNDVGGTMKGEGADASVADLVIGEIESAGGRAVASHESVASAAGARSMVEMALEQFGRLDAVVSNAGIFDTAPFEEITEDSWRAMIEVHLTGGFHLGQAAYGAMREQGYGRFVFISSSAGLFGQPNSAHYAAAKSGLVGLANVIAIEGAPHGILANTVLPFGYSRMVTETVGDREQLGDDIPFLNAIEPELVVPIVVYLASRNCTTTHQNFSACAGRFARAFMGLGEGWASPSGSTPNADDIEANFEQVAAVEPFSVPMSIFDEVAEICSRLGIAL